MAAIMQKVGWRFTLAASGVAGWYTYYLYSGSDPSLNVKISDTVVKTVVGAFVIEPKKMESVKWTPREKALVQGQLKKEENEKLRTGGLGENCKKAVWWRWGGEERWKVVGKDGVVVGSEVEGKKEIVKDEGVRIVGVEGVKKEDLKAGEKRSSGSAAGKDGDGKA